MNSSAKTTRFSTTAIQSERLGPSVRQGDGTTISSPPLTRELQPGTPSRTTTSASGASTNTHDLGASTWPQTRATIWWWPAPTSISKGNATTTENLSYNSARCYLPSLLSYLQASSWLSLPPPGELLEHSIQHLFQWPISTQGVDGGIASFTSFCS